MCQGKYRFHRFGSLHHPAEVLAAQDQLRALLNVLGYLKMLLGAERLEALGAGEALVLLLLLLLLRAHSRHLALSALFRVVVAVVRVELVLGVELGVAGGAAEHVGRMRSLVLLDVPAVDHGVAQLQHKHTRHVAATNNTRV